MLKFIKNIPNLIGVALYTANIISLTRNITNGEGEPILNYILLAVSAVFLIVYVTMLLRGHDKKQVKSAKRYFKWFKLGMKGISFLIIVYGFMTATGEESSMLMPCIMIALWLLQVNMEIMKHRARKRREKMKAKIDGFTSRFKKKPAESAPESELELTVTPVDVVEFSSDDF